MKVKYSGLPLCDNLALINDIADPSKSENLFHLMYTGKQPKNITQAELATYNFWYILRNFGIPPWDYNTFYGIGDARRRVLQYIIVLDEYAKDRERMNESSEKRKRLRDKRREIDAHVARQAAMMGSFPT